MQTNAAIPECAHDRTRRTEVTDRVGYRVALVVVGLVPGHARTHTHTPERRRDEEDEEGPATETHEDRRYHNDHYCETAEDRRQIDT